MGPDSSPVAAALLLLLALASTAAVSSSASMSILSYGERSDDEVHRLYQAWKAQHARSYNALDEDEQRLEIFRDNLRFIDQHNAAANAGKYSFRLGLTRFADLTNEEYRSTYLGVRTAGSRRRRNSTVGSNRYRFRSSDDLPDSIDWRDKGAVVDVKDQGSCGPYLLSFSLARQLYYHFALPVDG